MLAVTSYSPATLTLHPAGHPVTHSTNNTPTIYQPLLRASRLSDQLWQTDIAARADNEALLKPFHVEHKYKHLTLSSELAAAAAAQMLWWWSFPLGQAFYSTLRTYCNLEYQYISWNFFFNTALVLRLLQVSFLHVICAKRWPLWSVFLCVARGAVGRGQFVF